VVGGLPKLPRLRAAVAELPPGSALPLPLCAALGDAMQRYARLDDLFKLAGGGVWRDASPPHDWEVLRSALESRPATVAVAYDKVFHCHFLDTLDMLEVLGATVVDFSPLQDESLPEDVDLVYLGCGRPDQYAQQLTQNCCLHAALTQHVASGKRIYAEGGGLAYLAEELDAPAGNSPMLGLMPLKMELSEKFAPLRPVELTLSCDSWLANQPFQLRGYLNPNWRLQPIGDLKTIFASTPGQHDLVGHRRIVGGRVHLNFAAQPQALCSLLAPTSSSVAG
jgi:cobyrinic acid a,c-diamide synthase